MEILSFMGAEEESEKIHFTGTCECVAHWVAFLCGNTKRRRKCSFPRPILAARIGPAPGSTCEIIYLFLSSIIKITGGGGGSRTRVRKPSARSIYVLSR